MNRIRSFAFACAAAMLFACGSGFADAYTASAAAASGGTCGEHVEWKYSAMTETLIISGEGDMYNFLRPFIIYETQGEHEIPIVTTRTVPWSRTVKNVIIKDGVTNVGAGAFAECTLLESVQLPDSVTAIEDSAFQRCGNLTAVTLPDSVKVIGADAFSQTGLETVVFPESVTEIGNSAFDCCTELESVQFPKKLAYVGGRAFDGTPLVNALTESDEAFLIRDGVLLKANPIKMKGEITVPDGVRIITGNAFEHCDMLQKLTLPEGVTAICNYAFLWCSSMQAVILPDTLETIHYGGFFNCTALEQITLPPHLRTIGSDAFFNCSLLKEVTIPESVTKIEYEAFRGCSALKSVTILNPDTVIAESANVFTNPDFTNFHADFFDGVIRGYAGSTAEQYAKMFSRTFEVLDAPPAAETRGDLNGDSAADVSDAVLLARYLTEDVSARITDSGLRCADCNRDGTIDSSDLDALICCIARISPL